MEPIGVSFSPTSNPDEASMRADPSAAPIQSAIQTLNLRVPKVLGARAPINASLLNAAGSQGLPSGGMDLMAFLQRLFGAQTGPVSPMGGGSLAPSGGMGSIPGGFTVPGGGYQPTTNMTPGLGDTSGTTAPTPRVSVGSEAPAGQGLNDAPLPPLNTNTLGSNLSKWTTDQDRY